MRNLTSFLKKVFILRLVFAVTLLSLGSTAFAANPQVSVSEAGELKKVSASVVIDAPANVVWSTITNYNGLRSFMPGYKKSQVVGGSGANKTLALSVKVSSLLPAFNYQVKVNEQKAAYKINIKRTSGDFDDLTATYKLIPQGNKTQLVYNLNIDLGDNVPKLGANSALKSNAKDSLNALQKKCAAAHQNSQLASK